MKTGLIIGIAIVIIIALAGLGVGLYFLLRPDDENTTNPTNPTGTTGPSKPPNTTLTSPNNPTGNSSAPNPIPPVLLPPPSSLQRNQVFVNNKIYTNEAFTNKKLMTVFGDGISYYLQVNGSGQLVATTNANSANLWSTFVSPAGSQYVQSGKYKLRYTADGNGTPQTVDVTETAYGTEFFAQNSCLWAKGLLTAKNQAYYFGYNINTPLAMIRDPTFNYFGVKAPPTAWLIV